MSKWPFAADNFDWRSSDWWLDLVYWLFTDRAIRNTVCWWIALAVMHHYWWNAWEVEGHVTCDFAGQWLMGRMFVDPESSAKDLYIVEEERKVFQRGYPKPSEHNAMIGDILRKGYIPTLEPVAEPLMAIAPTGAMIPWSHLLPPVELIRQVESGEFKLHDPLIEGALYPPTAGLLFAPLALLPPKAAHMTITLIYLMLLFVNALLIVSITRGRIKSGEAALVMVAFPNFFQAQLLGQNSMLTLTILVLGWWFVSRRWFFWGGLIWGLLAYKPVFAVSMIIVPILLPSLRMLIGYTLGGGIFVLATLPWVGTVGLDRLIPFKDKTPVSYHNVRQTNPWERWLIVGKHAAQMYEYDRNWIWMSRDLTGLPRRAMWLPEDVENQLHYINHRYLKGVDTYYGYERGTTDQYVLDVLQKVHTDERSGLIGLGLILGLVLFTVTALLLRYGLSNTGLAYDALATSRRGALLLFTGGLACFHFMHYDLLIFTLPLLIMLSQWSRLSWISRIFYLMVVGLMLLCNIDMMYPRGIIRFPFETMLMIVTWLWTLLLTVLERSSDVNLDGNRLNSLPNPNICVLDLTREPRE